MSDLIREARVTCPACWEAIDIELDLSVDEQTYIEDCQVCCRPMQISYTASGGELVEVSVEPA